MKRNELSTPISDDPSLIFLWSIGDVAELIEIAHSLPKRQVNESIEYLLNHEEEFDRLIKEPFSLSLVAKNFPQFADKLIDVVISTPERFKQIIHFPFGLSCVLDRLTPSVANKLMDFVFDGEKKIYKYLIGTPYYLSQFLSQKNLRPYVDKLIHYLVKDPAYFKQVVVDMGDLLHLAILNPKHADTFFNRVIKDKEHFNKLLSIRINRSEQLRQFPKYEKIFSTDVPYEENEKARELYLLNAPRAEIRKNARLFAQAERTHSGLFFFSENMPRELRVVIAGFTGNVDLCNESEATQIAQEHFSRPQNSK